ncbi:hypothetical protein P879_09153 [Paragonimus westermani]|uniref:ATP synthase subunit f, mitochondrial n=1 Tax=Paragonimus westermani TaxID=34504 RepID=A0A8T0DEE6_9TREM|nr:hypothetical protein P879_09153 [Paragonimus westermani]
MLEFGLLPKEYNVRVHGAYFPGYYYGKPDTPLLDVKLGELPAWLSRRSRNPADWARAISRFGWRYTFKWLACKKLTFAPAFQICATIAVLRYFADYDEHKNERHSKYH